jgi:PTH1 family peptidyl-tRNA hydrolase
VLVVHDELDLEFGVFRLKVGGGEAGHNGLRSVTQHLGGRDYMRLRCGVGRPPATFEGDGADYVLQAFSLAERGELDRIIGAAADAAELVVSRGVSEAMNAVNRREKP